MRGLIKNILLKSLYLQEILLRSSVWLTREKYSQVEMSMFHELIDLLSSNKLHGVKLNRYGSKHDGGYILAELGIRYGNLISFGVGDNIDFEISLSPMVDAIELFDHTVDKLPSGINNATFHKIGLSDKCSDKFVNLESITPNTGTNKILKIDIEGDEWKSLANVNCETLNSYAQIVLELHDLLDINNPATLRNYVSVLSLLRKNHDLIFVHGNNWSQVQMVHGYLFPDVLEVTFLRRDFIVPGEPQKEYFDSLHSPNNPEYSDLKLCF
jgi:hypothetical protein